MVFGQCLRSLLEHQKNPKKPIEKHFKNSLLTRHLQDYMEGKKRMTLILTVKAAQEDYMDTSFILRQASPYMKIKFYLQENNNIPCQKRKAASFITERTKRMKVNISEVPAINGDHVVMDATASSKISVKDSAGEDICKQGNAELHAELQKIKRSEEVMRNFARALLRTLKQYKDKLKESENEVQYLKESLRKQSAHANEMEKELNETRNTRSCVSNLPVEECAKALSFNPGVSVPPIPTDPDHIQDTDALRDENNSFLSPETTAKIEMGRETKALDESLSGTKTTGDSDEFSLPLHPKTLEQVNISAEAYSRLPSEENVELRYQHSDVNSESFQKHTQSNERVGEMDQVAMIFSDVSSLKGPHSNAPVDVSANEHQFIGKTANHSYCFTRPTVPLESEGYILRLPGNEEISIMQAEKLQEQSGVKIAVNENVQKSTASHSTEPLKSEEDGPALRPLNSQRPKRMLLPASAIHFKDFNGLFMDENDMELKRKKTANVKARSDGSISLIRILKSNLPR